MGISNLSLSRSEPLFGLDIGHSSMKAMQLKQSVGKTKRYKIVGYGSSYHYDVNSINNGVIVDFKALEAAIHDLFNKRLQGQITTRKVACTIPTSHSFSRPLKLPAMNEDDISQAVHLEAEQYIPVAPENLYLDYDILRRDEKSIDVLVVATPKNIIDSYMKFLESMALEPVALEPTMNATARIFGATDATHNAPSVLIDFGANATDIAVFDNVVFVNNTVQGGSDTMLNLIATKLGVSRDEAYKIKNEEGIGFSDQLRDIGVAVKPTLDNLIREINKIARYFNERLAAPQHEVAQVVTIGGGANMPGLNEYLSKQLGLPVRMLNPWDKIDFGGLAPPDELERSMFFTVAGEAVLDLTEVFDD